LDTIFGYNAPHPCIVHGKTKDGFSFRTVQELLVHHDHGKQYLKEDFQAKLLFLNIIFCPASIQAGKGNGVLERFIRLLSEQFL